MSGIRLSDLPAETRARMGATATKPRLRAVGQTRTQKKMNRGEAAYERHLDARLDVAWHKFEGVTLKLGPDCRYTPDFVVMLKDGSLECHDVKGRKGSSYWAEEDATIKIRTAVAMFPFRFFIDWPARGYGWDSKEIVP